MLIDKLIVRKTRPSIEVIRQIQFNPIGLSLIIDNTPDVADESGNNVGKTTAIKIIDLCLGAKSPRSLYYDDDTKSENSDIKNFLNKYKVEAELVLNNSQGNNQVKICRSLYQNGIKSIDGEKYTSEEFDNKLKEILFDLHEPKPTFRQLITKFIRLQDTSEDKMIKYLPNMTSKETYDTIYLFLFKMMQNDLLSTRDVLSSKLKKCEEKIKIYENEDKMASLDSLRQRLELVQRDWDIYNEKRIKLDYMESYKQELTKKRRIATELKEIEEKIQILELDVRYAKESVKKLESEMESIDIVQIKELYKEAQAYTEGITKTFEQVIEFHNKMIKNRIIFIKGQLNEKVEQLSIVLRQREDLLEEKKAICVELLDEGLLEELNALNVRISELDVHKGQLQKAIELLESVNEERRQLIVQIEEIDKNISIDMVNDKIKKFNTYFSAYCEKMYGEKYLLVYHSNWKKEKNTFPVSIDFFNGKVGTGKKKGLIVAFDLAYLKYAQEEGIEAPQFVIHDKLENTHINQLKTIFELCNEINGQYIIPILRERVNAIDPTVIKSATVLELGSDNKFFKI